VTLDEWIRAHPYLRGIADLHLRLNAAAAGWPQAAAHARWNEYAPQFAMGVPLLQSPQSGVDLSATSDAIERVIDALAGDAVDDEPGAAAHRLAIELRQGIEHGRRPMDWLLGDDGTWAPSQPGLLRCVGWITAEPVLRPLLMAFDRWRDDDRWLRRYCPGCGSLPAMAQFTGKDPGRRRLMSCGCCRTRWRFARTGCPFCETESHRLAAVGVEGGHGLRIDYCESCRGYLKTYDGEGDETLLLADWTSLHLDVLAIDRGLKRFAPSLYDLGADSAGDSGNPGALRDHGGDRVADVSGGSRVFPLTH
jgi:FdhE protein